MYVHYHTLLERLFGAATARIGRSGRPVASGPRQILERTFRRFTSASVSGCFAAGSLYPPPERRGPRRHRAWFGGVGCTRSVHDRRCMDELAVAGYVKTRNLTIPEVACLGRKPHPTDLLRRD
jgi:hypothetical protein